VKAPQVEPDSLSEAHYLGFDGSTDRHRMGLRPLGENWLEPDRHRDWQLQLKQSLIRSDREMYVADPTTSVAQAGVARLAEMLSLDKRIEPTIEACGLATQEDWCIMVREDTWRLRAASVCFPSRWVLSEKLGGTLADIHEPVPNYEKDLGGLVESFFDRLDQKRAVWRLNWELWDDPRLSQPWRNEEAEIFDLPSAELVPERVFLRVERQTMRRLTDETIVFSIRVHQRPLADVIKQPEALLQLQSVFLGEGGPVLASKKLGSLKVPVLEWLAGTV
jgi:hypothetical protein